MNLLSNNCFGGHTYRYILNKEYENPFTWTRLFSNDLIKLIEDFNIINFNNYEINKKDNTLFQFYLKIYEKFVLCFDKSEGVFILFPFWYWYK